MIDFLRSASHISSGAAHDVLARLPANRCHARAQALCKKLQYKGSENIVAVNEHGVCIPFPFPREVISSSDDEGPPSLVCSSDDERPPLEYSSDAEGPPPLVSSKDSEGKAIMLTAVMKKSQASMSTSTHFDKRGLPYAWLHRWHTKMGIQKSSVGRERRCGFNLQ